MISEASAFGCLEKTFTVLVGGNIKEGIVFSSFVHGFCVVICIVAPVIITIRGDGGALVGRKNESKG